MIAVSGLPPLSPEVAWTVAALRVRYGPEDTNRLTKPSAQVDWDVLLATARRNAITQLMQSRARDLDAEVVPDEVRARLDSAALATRLRNLEQTAELLRVLALLEEAGIRAVPYKGPVLAQVAYGDLGLRQFGDLDVLIDRANVSPALDRLEADGYRSDGDLTPGRLEALLRTGHDWPLYKEDRFCVEVQWAIAGRAHVRPRGIGPLMDRAVTLELAGREIRTLAPTDQLVVLAMHGGAHLYSRLTWVCDVAEALRVPGVDPAAALAIAEGVGARRMLLLAIAMVDRVLDFRPAPELAAMASADPAVDLLLAAVLPATLERGGPDYRSAGARVATRVRLADHTLDGVRGAWRAVVTPTPSDWARVNLPDPLLSLYYPLRLGRLLGFVLGWGRGAGDVDVFDEH